MRQRQRQTARLPHGDGSGRDGRLVHAERDHRRTADASGETVLESVSITGDPVTVSQPVELPADIAAWKTRNEALADWQTLSEKLAKTDRINWLFTGDSITHGVQFTRGYRTYRNCSRTIWTPRRCVVYPAPTMWS